MSSNSVQPGDTILEKREHKIQTPKLYRVVLLNDDYTTMDFVIKILEQVFQKGPAEAFRLMMQIHTQGSAICGIYTYEIAETKVDTIRNLAKTEGVPLQVKIEE